MLRHIVDGPRPAAVPVWACVRSRESGRVSRMHNRADTPVRRRAASNAVLVALACSRSSSQSHLARAASPFPTGGPLDRAPIACCVQHLPLCARCVLLRHRTSPSRGRPRAALTIRSCWSHHLLFSHLVRLFSLCLSSLSSLFHSSAFSLSLSDGLHSSAFSLSLSDRFHSSAFSLALCPPTYYFSTHGVDMFELVRAKTEP